MKLAPFFSRFSTYVVTTLTSKKSNFTIKRNRFPIKFLALQSILIIVVVLVTVGISRFLSPKNSYDQTLETISKVLVLPDEEPTIAEVTDKNQLSQQEFFSGAENGDVVFLYTKHKKALLYRPSLKKVVEVAKVHVGNSP